MRPLADAISAAAVAAFPRESCGLLVGCLDGALARIETIHPSPNLATAAHRFEIDPALRLRLERELRGGPLRVVGHYHSHPGAPARPSTEDAARAEEAGLIWLIQSVTQDGAGPLAAFQARRAVVPTPAARFSPVSLL